MRGKNFGDCLSRSTTRIQPESCHISPLKVAATVYSGSGKGTIGA